MTTAIVKPVLKQVAAAVQHQRLSLRTASARIIGNVPYETFPITEENLTEVQTNTEPWVYANAIRAHFQQQTPVVFRGSVAQDPAIQNWKSLEYFRAVVPANEVGNVEIGGTYGNPSLERPEIHFADYLDYLDLFHDRHGALGPDIEGGDPWLGMGENRDNNDEPTMHEMVYMAQNDLFPALYKDVTIPAFCDDSSFGIGKGQLYSTMLWLGPRGCVSPLHYDPLDNILMQFVGRKRLILFERSFATQSKIESSTPGPSIPWHYAGSEGQQYNTSPINIEDSLEALAISYPLFCEAAPPAIYCVLNPGDAVYIPAKWWHHVRSLDTSASVNVWWR
jgi:Cupin-like domain